MSFEKQGPNIVLTDGTRETFNTSYPLMNLMPSEQIEVNNFDIVFPDFWKGVVYRQSRETIPGPPFPYDVHGCFTMTSPIAQEWGPTQPAPNTLPETILGTVPAGTEYLEAWVNLTRVVSPADWLDIPFSTSFPAGQWVKLEGGSCLIEEPPGFKRLFEVVLVGTQVVLRRYQSTITDGGFIRLNPGETIGNRTFFYPGTNAPANGAADGMFGSLIDQKFSAGTTHRPPGKEAGSSNNDPCSMSLTGKSLASTWRGTIRVIPGRMRV